MRLKLFQAPNFGAAMALVRDELGPDALILGSRRVDGAFEITAAHEDAVPDLPAPPTDRLDAKLRWHGVPDPLAARLATGDPQANLAREFSFGDLPCRPDDRPLLLVGPPGAGKTTAAARLATRLKLGGDTPHVISADGRRPGAAEQLAAITRLLGTTLLVADTPDQLARALARRPAAAPALIDMPGLDPADPADADFLCECAKLADAEVALVLPAGLDPNEAAELAAAFQGQGAGFLIATRLDQSRRLGGTLAAAAAGLRLTEAGVAPGIVDGFAPITPAFLAERIARAPDPASAPKPLTGLALLTQPRNPTPRTSP